MVYAAGDLHVVRYGVDAFDALARVIADAKRDDRLAPVTVLAPSALAAVTLRRRLASDGGVVAVDTVVLHGLAQRLASARLAAGTRRPLGPLEAAALARAALAGTSSRLGSVVEHPATIDALLQTFTELRPLDTPALARLASSSSRANEVVELFRSYRRGAAGWADDFDVVQLAIEAARAGDEMVDEIGTVVLHLPRRLDDADLALLAALHERGRLVAIIGTTGRDRADELQRALVDQLAGIGLRVPEDRALPAHEPPTTIVRAADPADEARAATRVVLDRVAHGVPADRIAIVSRVASPYLLLAHEELEAAGLAHSAPAAVRLAQRITGRTLLALLAWGDNGHRRDDLMRVLRGAPVLDADGGIARADRWDRLARDAGVVAGLDQWRQRLDAARASDGDDELDALRSFVDRLAADTDPAGRTSWSALSRWAARLVETYLGGEARVRAWPEPEQRSRAAVLELLDHLGDLDRLDPSPGPRAFRRVLEHELSRAAGRVGRFGHGVFVGRLVDAVGADLDTVIVLGCAEGVFPPRAADDPLLPDRDRRVLGGALRHRGTTAAEEERDALAAMASASSTVLTFPVADPRDQHTRQPAPFVLDQCSARLGERVDTDAIARLRHDDRAAGWFVDVPSFEWWLAASRAPATATELDVRELIAARSAGHPVEELPVARAAGIERGLAAAAARRDGDFGPWSGSVGRWAELADGIGHLRSATSLQVWASCPFHYFLRTVLEVRGLEDPGEAELITPADRGSLVHAILERYFGARIEGRPVDLEACAVEVEAEYRSTGRTGRPLLWDADWAALRRHVGRVLEAAEHEPVLGGVEPVAVEHRFGFDDPEVAEVVVDLGDGRAMRFRGAVDRIDRSPDGARLVVLDYKTGHAGAYDVLDADHPAHDIVARGTLLQLPVYGLAARDRFPGARDVEAYYWFIGQRYPVRMVGGPIDVDADARFRDVLRTIASGIEAGFFPARPGEESWYPGVGATFENCRHCEFDTLCPAGRSEQWVAISSRDELRQYVELAES